MLLVSNLFSTSSSFFQRIFLENEIMSELCYMLQISLVHIFLTSGPTKPAKHEFKFKSNLTRKHWTLWWDLIGQFKLPITKEKFKHENNRSLLPQRIWFNRCNCNFHTCVISIFLISRFQISIKVLVRDATTAQRRSTSRGDGSPTLSRPLPTSEWLCRCPSITTAPVCATPSPTSLLPVRTVSVTPTKLAFIAGSTAW